MCSLVISGLAFANQSDNPFIYDEPSAETMAEGDAPAGPGDPNPAPIDQYVPVLVIIAATLVCFYADKKKTA